MSESFYVEKPNLLYEVKFIFRSFCHYSFLFFLDLGF
jgi:hypothetical protein